MNAVQDAEDQSCEIIIIPLFSLFNLDVCVCVRRALSASWPLPHTHTHVFERKMKSVGGGGVVMVPAGNLYDC